jgi:hypothetical protein
LQAAVLLVAELQLPLLLELWAAQVVVEALIQQQPAQVLQAVLVIRAHLRQEQLRPILDTVAVEELETVVQLLILVLAEQVFRVVEVVVETQLLLQTTQRVAQVARDL